MAFWTRALDKITPWRRQGEVQRDLQSAQRKKKREEEQQNFNQPSNGLRVTNAQPNQTISVDQNKPLEVKKPQNIFEDGLNKNLNLGQPKLEVKTAQPRQELILPDGRKSSDVPDSPETIINRALDRGDSWEKIAKDNRYDLDGVKEYSQKTRPNYGIAPIAKPKQSIGNRFRDVFDANTESDKYRRQEGNKQAKAAGEPNKEKPINLVNPGNIVSRTPIVGHVTKMLNTAGAQIAELPATADLMIYTKMSGDLNKQLQEAKKKGNQFQINDLNRKIDIVNEELKKINGQVEAGHSMFEKNKGGLFNAGTLYDEEASKRGDPVTGLKDIALPTATTALDIYTLGQGSIISEGLKTGGAAGLRTVAPNIAKATAGNFASGAGNAVAEGGDLEDALKAGTINAGLGIVPDVGLPLLGSSVKNKVIPQIIRGRAVRPGVVADELDDAAISASAEAANQALRPRPISVAKDISVDAVEGLPQPIRVRNLNEPGKLIQEVTGDATTATPNPLIQRLADDARESSLRETAFEQAKNAGKPDMRIEGINRVEPSRPFSLTPEAVKTAQDNMIDGYAAQLRQLGEGNGTQLVPDGEGGYYRTSGNYRPGMGSGKVSAAAWREEAEKQLRSGKADPAFQKAFDDAADPEVQSMLSKGEQAPVDEGRPITVKTANSIPVKTDETIVPTNLPETPGTVRATTSAAPANTEAAAVAAQPAPASMLPPETQAILDNPKQFNKRQVAAARNQRKMARAVAKANEETAAAMDRINTASPAAASGEGFVPTGEFGKSVNGGPIQKVSRAAEMQQALEETSQMSPGDVIQSARASQAETGAFSRRDIRNIAALFESKRIPRGTPEWEQARQILKEDGTAWGQAGALRNYTMRRTATADQLISRYESKLYRLAEDPSKIDSALLDEVDVAETAFADARDEALRRYNAFTEAPTTQNRKLYEVAQDAADQADRNAKTVEYKVADKALKGNKDIKQVRELEKMQNEAGLYQMDAVDSSMLSGTGTFVRNLTNAALGGGEEGLFGGVASRIARKITGQEVGGGVGKGTLTGFKGGVRDLREASAARASNAGWNPLEHIKNYATTGNELGDTIIDSQVKHNVLDHYTQLLKEQGYKGKELADRAAVMARQDPDVLAEKYLGMARSAAGLGGGITRGNKVETLMKNAISDAMTGMGVPRMVAENGGKLITRLTVGFPTAIGRSLKEGVKRFTLGAPTFVRAIATKDPLERAFLIKEGIKQAGTGGMVIPPLFYAMGANDLITGAYPDDPDERARWEREGISENSIKIGGSYFQLPGYLGSWAAPALFYASLGRNDGDFKQATTDTIKIIPSILPTDNLSGLMDAVNGNRDPVKFLTQTASSAVRASTPGGALLAELAKVFDDTKNETNDGTAIENFVDKVLTGIPGASNTVPNKVTDEGDTISNPSPIPLALGATSAVQTKGEQTTANMQAKVDSGIQQMDSVLNDPNLQGALDDDEKKIYDKLKRGEKLKDGDLKKLEDAYLKGVSGTGDDTAYLEREQYDTNLAVLNLKKKKMEADKTTKPSDLKKMDTAIKRGEVYKEHAIPYDMIDSYQHIGVDEWRKMGIPPGDDNYDEDAYDPEMYQKLWDLDQLMTKAGGSYGKALDKQKYSAKEKKEGSGRGGKSKLNIDGSFGRLKAGDFSPQVQQYDTIDQKSGNIPIIRTVRPNIVHKIGSSG